MISTNDMRSGQAIIFDGKICLITDYERVKPGKGPSFVKAKLKDINSGQVLDKTWRGEHKVELAILQGRPHQYLYRQGNLYHFMDAETYDQIVVDADFVQDVAAYLKEGMDLQITFHKNKPVKVEVPNFLELKVSKTEPGVKGDTVSGAAKPATVETGAVVQVPLFVNEGDRIKVDTRTGSYVTRV